MTPHEPRERLVKIMTLLVYEGTLHNYKKKFEGEILITQKLVSDALYNELSEAYEGYLDLLPNDNLTKLRELDKLSKIVTQNNSYKRKKESSRNEELIANAVNFAQFKFYYRVISADITKLDLGLTAPKRKTKPTNETKLALTSNELMCLFRKLANEELFTSSDSSHLARGIESLCGHSFNKTRVKGQTMNPTQLKNIKKVIDNISAILQKDIEQGGI